VLGAELCSEFGGAGLHVDRAFGELGEQRVVDAVELERGGAVAAAIPIRLLDREDGGDSVGNQVVVQLGDGDGGLVQCPCVQRPPLPVGALHLVGDDEMGVQVGIACAGVPVVERGGDQASGGEALDTAVAGAGAGDTFFHEVQRGPRPLAGAPRR
jgi:hypothetical protein